jgi:hypothetical protein
MEYEPEIVEALAGLVEAGELTVLALRTSEVPPTPQVR